MFRVQGRGFRVEDATVNGLGCRVLGANGGVVCLEETETERAGLRIGVLNVGVWGSRFRV